MTYSKISVVAPVSAPLRPALMADMLRFGVRFAPPDEGGGGGDDAAAAEAARLKVEADAKKRAKPDAAADALAAQKAESERLAAELRELKAAQASLNTTPAELAELRKMKTEAERLKAEADAAKARAEEEELRKKGDFDALKQRMADEHKAQIEAQAAKTAELQALVNGLNGEVNKMTLGTAFAASKFISENTVLSASKAKMIYGDHFDIEEGALVGYDAPRGATRRTQLVDGGGKPLVFDEAVKRLVEADEDRDTILRSGQKPGSGQVDTKAPIRPIVKQPHGIDRIRAGLAEMRKPK